MKVRLNRAAASAAAAFVLAAGTAWAADTTISAGKLAHDAKDFYGKTVTVKAEVEDVLGNNMFTLDEDSVLSGPDVLVLVPGGIGTLVHDQKVIVTGEVRPYVEADLDRDYDWFEHGKLVDVKTKVDWKTRPVVVARSVRTEQGSELMTGATQTSEVTRTTTTTTTTTRRSDDTMHAHSGMVMTPISAGKLAHDAKHYYGQTVSVKAEVEDVLGSNMFTLDEDAILSGPDVLVLVPRGVAGTLTHDQKVIVTGKVRPYVEADLDKDYDWFDNGKLVDVKTKVDWKTRPIIVADTIRTESGTEIALR
jgi:hypothetical protein